MKYSLVSATILAGLLAACGEAQVDTTTDAPAPPPPSEAADEATGSESIPSMLNARAMIVSGESTVIGEANLNEGPNGVLMRITLNPGALEPGWHGLHLHQIGDCSDYGVFTNSGGHVGKVEGGHGLLNADGPEGGDLPNIWVASDGSAGYEAFTTLTSASELLDEDGSAIIIHEGEDDHMSQPIGGAGGRVACGVIN